MTMRSSFLIVVLSLCSLAHAIDRDAFTITRYQLEVQIDRTTHVMAVTGKLTLRNDSKIPEKNIALQVSSSLAWNSITLDDKPVQWLGENYTSDIDHTGSLSEAIVTLPKAVPPAASVTLDVQYGGTITPDATRLTRMGAPADVGARNDWDQISDAFTAVRGLGYVAWYPVGHRSGEHERWQCRLRCYRRVEAASCPQRVQCSHHRAGRKHGIAVRRRECRGLQLRRESRGCRPPRTAPASLRSSVTR